MKIDGSRAPIRPAPAFSASGLAVSRPPARILARELSLVACALLALTVGLQYRVGAYGAEFDYDENSHYVSGLMIHDYVAALAPGSPLAFLRTFHSSYPLVGIGHWGPAYYVVEAAWMLPFGCSRAAVLLLSAGVTAVTALIVYGLAAPRFGRVLAVLSAVACIASPIIQAGTAAVMLDGAITLICLLAALAYSRYLFRAGMGSALLFGLLAAAGLLIKGNAACLALLPPLALLIGRRWRAWRAGSFWLPALVVVVVAGPWVVFTYDQVAAGFRYRWGWDFTSVAVPANLTIMMASFGPLLLPVGAAGFLAVCGRRAASGDDVMVAMAALFAAVMLFQCAVPAAIQDRYLAPALPPQALLAALAIDLARRLPSPRWSGRVAATAATVVCLTALPSVIEQPAKRRFGMIEAARRIWALRPPDNPAVLIVTDGAAEGALIAELAMRDPARPSLFAVRGSRLLGAGGYNAGDYQPRFKNPGEVMAAIDDYAIPLVLVRDMPGHNQWAHVDQVGQARALWPDRWETVYEAGPPSARVTLYRIAGNTAARADGSRLRALSAPRALGEGG